MSLEQSHRLRDQIRLQNKMKVFKNNLRESRKMMAHKSADVLLADKIFSQRKPKSVRQSTKYKNAENKYSPLKNKKLSSSNKKNRISSSSNKSLSASKLIAKSLQNKTSYLQDLVSKTGELLMQKKQYQQKIFYLKQRIAVETRKLKQAQQKAGKYTNQIQQYNRKTERIAQNYLQIKTNSEKERQQSMKIKVEADRIVEQVNLIKLNIKIVKNDTKKIRTQVKYLHNEIRNDIAVSGQIKNSLRDSQKKLKNQMTTRQELAKSKANILLEADSIVMHHKR